MAELNNTIAILETRCEQLVARLRSTQRTAPDAEATRSTLLAMLLRLVALKSRQQREIHCWDPAIERKGTV